MINNVYKINLKYIYLSFFLGLYFFLFINIPISYATISTDNSTYYVGDPIMVTDDNPHTILYNTDTDEQIYMVTNIPARRPTYNVLSLLGQSLPAGNYSIISLLTLDQVNQDACTSYLNCLSAPDFIMEAVFSVIPVPSSPLTTAKRRVISQKPKIQILSPKANSVFSNSVIVDYIATDKNDIGTDEEKIDQGLGEKPVSIYYSDNNFEWYPDANMFVNPNYKKLIVKDLPGTSQYKWSTENLIEGNLYRIIVDATDNYGILGEEVSGYFTVDFTPPVFKVKTEPTLVKTGDVKIFVEASEDLQKVPTVLVTQKGSKPISVNMILNGDIYEGDYTIQEGYDGTASINVEGSDLVGNIGREIIEGGTFSIGVNPPPRPNITSSINKTVTDEGYTVLQGTVREDTEAILYVNGLMIATTKPDSKGNFIFDKIKLDKIKNQGVNRLKIISRDVLGTDSESSNIEIKYNIVPTVSLTKPINKSQLTGTVELVAKGVDENLDTLLYTFEIISVSKYDSKSSNDNWIMIADGITNGVLAYDTTESDDGDYMIRARVSDGSTTVVSEPVQVSIKSSSSYFRFENGRKTVTNKSSVIINGKIVLIGNSINSSSIKTIRYSLDDGETWNDVKFDNLYSAEQKFSVNIDNLKEGIHPVMWAMTDNNGSVAKGSHIIIVDNTAPKAPIIKNPKNNSVITNESDADLKKNGVQINISGTAEVGTFVGLVFNNQILTTKVSLFGEFTFSGITIDKTGKKDMKLFAVDEVANKSSETNLTFTYNNPPRITFINPKSFGALSSKPILSWNITDMDGDTIKNVELSFKDSSGVFKTILKNAEARGTYLWDASNFQESRDYALRITATDSLTPVSLSTNFVVDKTPPKLLTFDIKREIANKNISLSYIGTASDILSGISSIEYSVKSENDKDKRTWYKGTINKGYFEKQATYSIKYPDNLSDGSYTIYARAVDVAGNVSNQLTQSFSIDRTPPTVGSFFIKKDNLNLTPDQDGKVEYYKNSDFTFAVSIEKDARAAVVTIGNKNINLNKNVSTGLWEANMKIDIESTQDILITAIDDFDNTTKNKKIGALSTVNYGNVVLQNDGSSVEFVGGATIHIYKFNENTGGYDKFIPTQNGIDSVIKTDENGSYTLTLPIGKYQLIAVKSGFKVIKKDIILSKTEIVNDAFVSKKISGIERILNDVFNNWFY